MTTQTIERKAKNSDTYIKRTLKEKVKLGIWKLSKFSMTGSRDVFLLTNREGILLDNELRTAAGTILRFIKNKEVDSPTNKKK